MLQLLQSRRIRGRLNATRSSATAAAFPAESCNACHEGAAADDFVFTQYYPVLREGKATGEKGTGGMHDTLMK